MARQIDNAMSAHAEHQAEYSRRAAFHQPRKQVQRDQHAAGGAIGYPTAPHDSHRFGPGKDGGDGAKMPCDM
jgi:hypothetical protein